MFKIVKDILRSMGAGRLFRMVTNNIEAYLWGIPAFLLYVGLLLLKIIGKKRVVFCSIRCDRIGHLAANTELFLRRLRAGNYYPQNNIYIGFCSRGALPVSNRQLLNMYKRYFTIVESRILEKLMHTWIRKTEFYHLPPFNTNEYYEFNNFEPILSFTEEEEARGRQLLAEMGISKKDWFVCFHCRDSAYLPARRGGVHDYRNSSIDNYLKAAEYIAKQGGYAIRMGASVDKPLSKERHPRIIDYAKDFRSDFMDIYLSAKCKFFIGSTAGLHLVPIIFGVPVVGINFTPLELPPVGRNSLFIPKKTKRVKDDRILSFSEIFAGSMGRWIEGHKFVQAGLELIENTQDEILELTQEMNEVLNGGFQYTKEDIALQSRYHALIQPHHYCYKMPIKIGALFLRENKELLN